MTEIFTHNPTREEFKASLLETFKPKRPVLNIDFADGPAVTFATLALGFADIFTNGRLAAAVGGGMKLQEHQYLDIPSGLAYTSVLFLIAACAYYGAKEFAQRIQANEEFDKNLKLYLNSEYGQL